MIGRRVRSPLHRKTGEIIRWEPLGAAMCDALVRHEDSTECWYASYGLIPIDEKGPLLDRHTARAAARSVAIQQLEAIRAQHVQDFYRPWPGAEHGKALVGQMIDGALRQLKDEE